MISLVCFALGILAGIITGAGALVRLATKPLNYFCPIKFAVGMGLSMFWFAASAVSHYIGLP